MWSLATTALVSAAVGTGMQVYEGVKAGQAQKQAGQAAQAAANDQAALEDYNASVASAQAKDALAQGDVEADRFRTQVRGMVGTQRAGIAGGNVDVGYGSAVDVQSDAERLGELDALQIKTNAARTAWGYNVQAYNDTRQAAITRKSGANAAAAANAEGNADYFRAATSGLVGGVSLLQAKYGGGGSSAPSYVKQQVLATQAKAYGG